MIDLVDPRYLSPPQAIWSYPSVPSYYSPAVATCFDNLIGKATMTKIEASVDAYILKHPVVEYLRDDLIQESALEFWTADEANGDIDAYIRTVVRRVASRYQAEYEGRGASAKTSERRRKAGKPIKIGKPLDDFDMADDEGVHAIRETIESCCEDDIDLSIVDLRSQNYTDSEIAEQLNLSRSSVQARRQSLEARYNALARD